MVLQSCKCALRMWGDLQAVLCQSNQNGRQSMQCTDRFSHNLQTTSNIFKPWFFVFGQSNNQWSAHWPRKGFHTNLQTANNSFKPWVSHSYRLGPARQHNKTSTRSSKDDAQQDKQSLEQGRCTPSKAEDAPRRTCSRPGDMSNAFCIYLKQ
jgi:hypothetical protein